MSTNGLFRLIDFDGLEYAFEWKNLQVDVAPVAQEQSTGTTTMEVTLETIHGNYVAGLVKTQSRQDDD